MNYKKLYWALSESINLNEPSKLNIKRMRLIKKVRSKTGYPPMNLAQKCQEHHNFKEASNVSRN